MTEPLFSEHGRKWKKRPYPPVFNGLGSGEDKNNDYLCPICFEMISEAYMTKCGHTFCHDCISTSLEYNKRCPKCNLLIEGVSDIFPNFLLNDLIAKEKSKYPFDNKKKCANALQNSSNLNELQSFLSREKGNLTIEEINAMLEILGQKKQQLEADCRETQILLLKEFLATIKAQKQEELKLIQQQIKIIEKDSAAVEGMLAAHTVRHPQNPPILQNNLHPKIEPSTSNNVIMSTSNNVVMPASNNVVMSTSNNVVMSTSNNVVSSLCSSKQDGFNGSKYVSKLFTAPTLAARRKRMHEHIEDLKQSYLTYRSKDIFYSNGEMTGNGLELFDQDLSKFGRFNSVRPLATLNYSSDTFVGSNIVSSIEFDKDNEYFAIAGVTKKIKVFEFASVIRDAIDMHYAVNEMTCNSKISCISWSSFHKNMLASSDYEGTVTLWDAFTSQKLKAFQEHEKRCWSVDFNKVDTHLIASGSDDAKVKLWATNMEHSFATLEAKANVCCVKFNPDSRNYLAFGSADHCVHYYDLRNASQSVEVFKGHKKAVSYVKFLNGKEIVSASTDSQLKLWNVNNSYSLRSFKGHLNEKNFVGLATDGDFVACGSENNALYIYFKGLSSQVLTYKFEAIKSILEKDKKEEDSNEFVSAVCWRLGSNVVVAANSQGNIKILELV
ncbi:E3 ubiquitin-protein ligase COP1-like [Argiope bruennichi]|uniref:E3 ubiquitin-protein ligase COP1 like protein n=1 Tax=Argiope bruennichi TaxID=94029 RepID=A0A8T0FR63_ARGBR|nr:E3 ubiquitin-protein ligase COP1-like [Argiope bruennichi]KAF8792668.1 E3 ubiquitin-protein ligase COP1 like protein [Argiope bruennichi]